MSLRYVILRHDGVPEPHFDVMVETVADGPLMTWRSSEWPIATEANLTKLGEHRREYLEYEGPVSNDRGFVKRVEAGQCEIDWTMRHDFVLKLTNSKLHLRWLENDHWVATPVK